MHGLHGGQIEFLYVILTPKGPLILILCSVIAEIVSYRVGALWVAAVRRFWAVFAIYSLSLPRLLFHSYFSLNANLTANAANITANAC